MIISDGQELTEKLLTISLTNYFLVTEVVKLNINSVVKTVV